MHKGTTPNRFQVLGTGVCFKPQNTRIFCGQRFKPQNCAVRISGLKHDFSTPGHKILTIEAVFSVLKTLNYNILLIIQLAILAMGTPTPENFSNQRTEIQNLFYRWQKVTARPCLGSLFMFQQSLKSPFPRYISCCTIHTFLQTRNFLGKATWDYMRLAVIIH